MYNWRKMTAQQREDVLRLRKALKLPWHSPPHRAGDRQRFHVTAACYEHRPVVGVTRSRMAGFEAEVIGTIADFSKRIHAWAVLPNHYHLLVETTRILDLLEALGRMHGRLSHAWNGEDGRRGRKVWCGALETAIKSEGHFWATMNYVHHNPVRHKYVKQWQDWPFSSAARYLREVGHERAREIWLSYPIRSYGKDWDPPEL